MTPSPKAEDLIALFAAGRATAVRMNRGPDEGFAQIWLPKVAGRHVRLSRDIYDYPDRASALNAARNYRDLCRRTLQEQPK